MLKWIIGACVALGALAIGVGVGVVVSVEFNARLSETFAWGYFGEASGLLEEGDWAGAYSMYHRADVHYPNWYAPDLALAQMCVSEGMYELARHHLSTAETDYLSELPEPLERYESDAEEIERLRGAVDGVGEVARGD